MIIQSDAWAPAAAAGDDDGLVNVDIHMESTANRHNTQKSYKYEGLQDVLFLLTRNQRAIHFH